MTFCHINADLLQPISFESDRLLEQHLTEIVRRRSQWLAENKDALDEYNA